MANPTVVVFPPDASGSFSLHAAQPGPAKSGCMTPQQKIAAALIKAGTPSSAEWPDTDEWEQGHASKVESAANLPTNKPGDNQNTH